MSPARPPVAPTEKEFQAQVVELARLLGWRLAHFRPAVNRRGHWATPMQGDAGWPDLVLCRPPRLVFAELKAAHGRLSPDQAAWLEALGACTGAEVHVWRPDDLEAIAAVLRGPAPAHDPSHPMCCGDPAGAHCCSPDPEDRT